MLTVQEASVLIREKKMLLLAGSEQALEQLPPGNWIGGTPA